MVEYDYIDDEFNTSGKIATDANFWDGAEDNLVDEEGITLGFSKMIGEQVFRPLNAPTTPMYNRFAAAPLKAGNRWKEDAVKIGPSKRLNLKATAEDDLQFYDSAGVQKIFETNLQGWRPQTLPSDLGSLEEFMTPGGPARLNNLLLDGTIVGYQQDMEAMMEKVAVSMCKDEVAVDPADMRALYKTIITVAAKMMSNDYHFNALTPEENEGLYTASNKVLAFIDQITYNDMVEARADTPSPEQLEKVNNVEWIVVKNKLATPLTNEEWAVAPSGTFTWSTKPPAIGKARPLVFLCSEDYLAYRPLGGSYKMNLSKNGAGDFTNAHLVYRGALVTRPWENAVRIVSNALPAKAKATKAEA